MSTNTLVRPRHSSVPVGWIGSLPRLLDRPSTEPLPSYSRNTLLAMLDAVSLTGRGGAGFPTAAKIRALRPGAEPIVVVNGAEGEPVSAKDHALLGQFPQLVLDGAQIVAEAVGARRVLVAIADAGLVPALQPALRPGFELHQVPERFISGEARALVSALNGLSAVPPGRRVLPVDHGVNGRPTLVCNTETLAHVAVLARTGPAHFASVGTATEPGTTLVTVTGAVTRPGVYEIPLGFRMAELADQVGAQPSQAVVTGGFHGSWLPTTDFALSRQGVSAVGGSFGAGVLIFVGRQTCALAELTRVAHWLADQSAKQCGPCQFGLPALADDLAAALHGLASPLTRQLDQVSGRGACAHPDGAVRFIRSGLGVLEHELVAHRHGGCGRPDLGQLATSRNALGWTA